MPGLIERIRREKESDAKKHREEAFEDAVNWHDRYRLCFSTKQGKKVLEDLMRVTGIEHSNITRDNFGRIDPSAVLLKEGRRQVGLHIQGRLTEPKREGGTDE